MILAELKPRDLGTSATQSFSASRSREVDPGLLLARRADFQKNACVSAKCNSAIVVVSALGVGLGVASATKLAFFHLDEN